MFEHKLRAASILLLLGIAMVAPAWAEGPGAGFKLNAKATVFTSPDRKVRVEQYVKTTEDGGLLYQFWTLMQAKKKTPHGSKVGTVSMTSRRAHFRCLPISPKTTRRQSNILSPNEIDRQTLMICRHQHAASKVRKTLASIGKISMLQPETASLA